MKLSRWWLSMPPWRRGCSAASGRGRFARILRRSPPWRPVTRRSHRGMLWRRRRTSSPSLKYTPTRLGLRMRAASTSCRAGSSVPFCTQGLSRAKTRTARWVTSSSWRGRSPQAGTFAPHRASSTTQCPRAATPSTAPSWSRSAMPPCGVRARESTRSAAWTCRAPPISGCSPSSATFICRTLCTRRALIG